MGDFMDVNEDNNLKNMEKLLNEKDIQINDLKQQLANENQINNKTKEYLLFLESKMVDFDKQKEIIRSLNTKISKLNNEVSEKNNEINALKQELESSKLTESYIMNILNLRKTLDEL